MTAKTYPELDRMPIRSAWNRGVKAYARDLLQTIDGQPVTRENLLNGASTWNEWAYGGCGLVYDTDIAERLCSPSELKRKNDGALPPNSREQWLDVEARAVSQAARWLLRIYRS